MKDILTIEFDTKNKFLAYQVNGAESNSHEAAYDAYITGYVFAKILKQKQIEEERFK